jgi:hypothetical protein
MHMSFSANNYLCTIPSRMNLENSPDFVNVLKASSSMDNSFEEKKDV